jgi:hypothetical protein
MKISFSSTGSYEKWGRTRTDKQLTCSSGVECLQETVTVCWVSKLRNRREPCAFSNGSNVIQGSVLLWTSIEVNIYNNVTLLYGIHNVRSTSLSIVCIAEVTRTWHIFSALATPFPRFSWLSQETGDRRHRPYRVEKDISPVCQLFCWGMPTAWSMWSATCHQVLSGLRRHSGVSVGAVAGLEDGEETSASITVSVSDEGPGISKES